MLLLRACAQDTLQAGIRFAVNVTGQALSEPSFADFVRTQIKRNGLPAGLLDFEFTETASVRNLNAARRFIARVMEVGSRIALDDFGTGLVLVAALVEIARPLDDILGELRAAGQATDKLPSADEFVIQQGAR